VATHVCAAQPFSEPAFTLNTIFHECLHELCFTFRSKSCFFPCLLRILPLLYVYVQVIPFLLLAIVFAIPAAAISGRITSRFGVRKALLACLIFSVVNFSLFSLLVRTMVWFEVSVNYLKELFECFCCNRSDSRRVTVLFSRSMEKNMHFCVRIFLFLI